MTQRNVLPIASVLGGGYHRPTELPHHETFPGAACYQPIELPCYKAAPLQAFGPLNPQRVRNPSGFLRHPALRRTSRDKVSNFCVLCAFSRLFLVLLCSLFDELD